MKNIELSNSIKSALNCGFEHSDFGLSRTNFQAMEDIYIQWNKETNIYDWEDSKIKKIIPITVTLKPHIDIKKYTDKYIIMFDTKNGTVDTLVRKIKRLVPKVMR